MLDEGCVLFLNLELLLCLLETCRSAKKHFGSLKKRNQNGAVSATIMTFATSETFTAPPHDRLASPPLTVLVASREYVKLRLETPNHRVWYVDWRPNYAADSRWVDAMLPEYQSSHEQSD